MKSVSDIVLWIVALFYGHGALVHVLNIVGATGIYWRAAPWKWQVLDIVYLVLDVIVLATLPRALAVGIAAFYIAAVSQLVLYTVGRAWVLDVPEAFRPMTDQTAYLDSLVAFHFVTLGVVTLALRLRR